MGHVLGDLSFAVRGWRRSPGLIAAAVLAIALGVSANSTIFSFVSAVLLDPLPYPDPSRIVVVWQDFRKISGREREWTSPGLFLEWQRRSMEALSSVAVLRGWAPSITGVAEPERLTGAAVSGAYFDVLGAKAARGRLFSAVDDRPGAPTVAVISHGLWQRRFAGDPAIVGTTLQLDEEPVTVIGITEPGFEPAIIDAEIWSTTRIPPGAPTGMVVLRAIGRVRPNIAVELARERMSAMARTLADEGIGEAGAGILLEPLSEELTGPVRTPLLALMASVGFVLLIACVNVALLLLARSASRAREITVRASLGASRGRLFAQLLTETLLLATLGAALGLLLTFASLDAIIALAPAAVPRLREVRVDSTVLLFTAGVTVGTTVLAGLLPAALASRADLMSLLRDTSGRAGLSKLHRSMVMAQIAMAVILLSGAGQMLRSLDQLQRVDLGFRPEGAVAASTSLPRTRYQSEESLRLFYGAVLERLADSPAIGAAAAVSVLPLSGSDTDVSFSIDGRPVPSSRADEPVAWFRVVSHDYFTAMGIPLKEGRAFADADRRDSPCVVIVNQALTTRYWPDGGAVGARLFVMGQDCEVVGRVVDVHHRGPATPPEAEMYLSMQQRSLRNGSIVVRATGSTEAAATALRSAIRSADPGLPPGNVRTLDEMLGRALEQPRFIGLMSAAFAVVAFVLALVGVHGLLSYGVSRRTREIGIRMAVGASRKDVAALIARHSVITIAGGLTAGLAGAFVLSRAIAGLLFGIEPGDPTTAFAVVVLVLVAGVLATLVPANRATRVDPNLALKTD